MTNRPHSHSRYLPFVALAVLALLWGYNWVVMKIGMRHCDPFTFTAMRNVLGALAILLVVALRRGPLRPKPFWWIIIFGVFQTSLFTLAAWAVSLGDAGKASVLTYTMPFWILLFAWPVLGERIKGLQWAGVALALAGLILILGPWSLTNVWASLMAVGAGVSWAIAAVLFKIIRRRHHVDLMSFTAWQTLFGSIPVIIVALLVDDTGPVWNGELIGALVYNVILASAVAYVLWLYILHSLPAGTAGMSSLIIPVVGFTASWIQLGERPDATEAVGMGLILLALAALAIWGLVKNRGPAPPPT